MELCPMCVRIKKIREKQRKEFFADLCLECQLKFLSSELKKEKVLERV